MKTLAIHVDMRNSKSKSFNDKKKLYTDLYKKMGYFEKNGNYNNISHRCNLNVGDGVILVFNVNALQNPKEIMKILSVIDQKTNILEAENAVTYGVGISYGITADMGEGNLISCAIDGASTGSNLGMKYKISGKLRRWVLPLKVADDGEGSIEKLLNIIQGSEHIWSKKSASGKNLWFNFE